MPFVWKESEVGWRAEALAGGALAVAAADPGGGAVLLLRSRSPAGEEWFVLAVSDGGVELNGAPLHTGIRALRDRDLLVVEGVGDVFFTGERLAQVVEFPGSETPVYCPRDQRALLAGESAVQCPAPACAAVHHTECWLYARHCALCDQPTALDNGFRWTPDELCGAGAPSAPAAPRAGVKGGSER